MIGTNVWDLIVGAGPVAKGVLAVLGSFSIACWAIILERAWLFGKIRRDSVLFLKYFEDRGLSAGGTGIVARYAVSPLAQVYGAACGLFPSGQETATSRVPAAQAARAMKRAASAQLAKMESYLGVLATTASAAPFIGLFGTVWGVMESFRGIGSEGSASLAVVAPGISEALIATAAGLAAAIPAVMAYNFFVNRARFWAREMDRLSLEILNRLES